MRMGWSVCHNKREGAGWKAGIGIAGEGAVALGCQNVIVRPEDQAQAPRGVQSHAV